MIGKRVDAKPGEEHLYPSFCLRPGEYGKDLNGTWHCCAPRDSGDSWYNFFGNLSGHKVVEHDDGTITVSPSIEIIICPHGEHMKWHGFLEKGIWREC